jgi:hypothetical protein
LKAVLESAVMIAGDPSLGLGMTWQSGGLRGGQKWRFALTIIIHISNSHANRNFCPLYALKRNVILSEAKDLLLTLTDSLNKSCLPEHDGSKDLLLTLTDSINKFHMPEREGSPLLITGFCK